jgi:hypothetical protein
MPPIYLETSIICQLTDPPSNNPITRACQQVPQLWWRTRCDPTTTYVSDYVHDDITNGDPLRATRRLQFLQRLFPLPKHEKIESFQELLICGGGLMANAKQQASHIACAAFYHCDVLLTWDCKNIANARTQSVLRMLMNDGEYLLPELITPFGLMENSYETLWRRNSRRYRNTGGRSGKQGGDR